MRIKLFLSGGGKAVGKVPLDQRFASSLSRDSVYILPQAGCPDLFPVSEIHEWLEEHDAFKAIDFVVKEDLFEFTAQAKDSNPEAIMVTGGNTFLLLSKLQSAGAVETILSLLSQGTTYYGHSAGSILLGSDIRSAEFPPEQDPNDVGVSDLTGLNLLNGFNVAAHYDPSMDDFLIDIAKKSSTDYIALSERSGAFFDGSVLHSVGDDPCWIATSRRVVRLPSGNNLEL